MTPATASKRGQGKRAAQTVAEGRQNGQPTPEQQALADAIEHEQKIAADATKIRDEYGRRFGLNGELLEKLRPLLRKPIPAAFIEHVDEKPGKPYESTGVRSVQVQMDRLDNVLGPENWGYSRTFWDDGKLCEVIAWVGPSREEALFERDSYGGVKQGSTAGNIYKGSFTNAAKPAFARLGPAWEVYVGAADFDPDTDEGAAKAQEQTAAADEKDPNRPLSTGAIEKLRAAISAKSLTEQDVSNKLRAFGTDSFGKLTAEQGVGFWEWVNGADAPEKSDG